MKTMKQAGFTIVEIITAVTVTSILLMVIMNFMADGLINYAVIQARRDTLNQAQIALDKIADETRLSASADENNRWEDENAPNAPENLLSWQSSINTLILASAAQNQQNEILFADPALYITEKNNSIYFVDAGTLYKRTLASPVEGNKATTSCPPSASTNTCPADEALISNVANFVVRYINGAGEEVTPPNARAIELEVDIAKQQYGREITADYKTRMVFRND